MDFSFIHLVRKLVSFGKVDFDSVMNHRDFYSPYELEYQSTTEHGMAYNQ